MPDWDPPILPIARRRRVSYTVERDPNDEFVDFGIDGAPFDPARPPYRIKLGAAEEWTVTNRSADRHPATEPGARDRPRRRWQDRRHQCA